MVFLDFRCVHVEERDEPRFVVLFPWFSSLRRSSTGEVLLSTRSHVACVLITENNINTRSRNVERGTWLAIEDGRATSHVISIAVKSTIRCAWSTAVHFALSHVSDTGLWKGVSFRKYSGALTPQVDGFLIFPTVISMSCKRCFQHVFVLSSASCRLLLAGASKKDAWGRHRVIRRSSELLCDVCNFVGNLSVQVMLLLS